MSPSIRDMRVVPIETRAAVGPARFAMRGRRRRRTDSARSRRAGCSPSSRRRAQQRARVGPDGPRRGVRQRSRVQRQRAYPLAGCARSANWTAAREACEAPARGSSSTSCRPTSARHGPALTTSARGWRAARRKAFRPAWRVGRWRRRVRRAGSAALVRAGVGTVGGAVQGRARRPIAAGHRSGAPWLNLGTACLPSAPRRIPDLPSRSVLRVPPAATTVPAARGGRRARASPRGSGRWRHENRGDPGVGAPPRRRGHGAPSLTSIVGR